MNKKLLNLWTGELASVLVFWWLIYVQLKIRCDFILFNLAFISIVLIQGSLYWFILSKRVKGTKIGNSYCTFFKIMRIIDMLIIIAGLIFILIRLKTSSLYHILLALFWWAFGIIEYINYFFIRLSYPNLEIISIIKDKNYKESRLAKDLKK